MGSAGLVLSESGLRVVVSGGNSLWTHSVLTGVASRVVAEGDEAPVPGGGRPASVSSTTHLVSRTGEVVFAGTVWGARGTQVFSGS